MNVVLVYRGRYHVREALDLELLWSVLRQEGHRVAMVYDPDTFGRTDNVLQIPALARLLESEERTLQEIVDAKPEVVLFSVLSTTYGWCRKMAAAVKERTSAAVVFLGLHPSLVPERVMEDRAVDYTIAGEVENVVHPLLDAIGSQRDPRTVPNLWYRAAGELKQTGRAELVDLDRLPLPNKDLFAPFVSHRYSYSAMVSRGCPYSCTFCEETCSKKLYGGRYFRRKGVETVMRELAAGKRRYRFREVIFKDSYLSGSKRWLAELMERYRREIGAPFKCFCTVTGFDRDAARMLKEGGCYSIEFGLQTWNDKLRRDVLDRRETAEDAFRAFGACDRERLRYDVDHMFNLPTETRQDHELGVRSYRRLKYLGRIKVHFLVYFPTAEIVDHAVAAGDLPADARRQLAEGHESDFYDQAGDGQERKELVAGYAALYKILPMLPEGLLQRLLRGDRVLGLRRIPAVGMAAMQGLNAIRCGDLRFLAYLEMYPVKIVQSILRALRGRVRLRRTHE
jgi:hypothetical protein